MPFLTQISSLLPSNRGAAYSGPIAQSLEILLLQPTPFCNIDCDYCYLPQRNETQRMRIETITGAVRLVMDGGLTNDRLSIVWHAGEPLVLPVSFYEEAFAAIEEVVRGKVETVHSFQTNGTLIDDAWCGLFKRYPTRIGLSIDGPAFVHDIHRKTRQGRPTHAETMAGAAKLRKWGVPFHVIAVISADSLDHVEEIFRFFKDLQADEVGFNVEELEGNHDSSSLTKELATGRIRQFWQRLYELGEGSDGGAGFVSFEKRHKLYWQQK